jgi:hypothetical protein
LARISLSCANLKYDGFRQPLQNPQYRRKKEEIDFEEETLP